MEEYADVYPGVGNKVVLWRSCDKNRSTDSPMIFDRFAQDMMGCEGGVDIM